MSHHRPEGPSIPDDSAPVAPAHRPTWWTVRTVRAVAFACVGLAVALSLVSTLVSWRGAQAANARAVEVEQRLAALEEYVQGRGEFRDAEAERLGERIDRVVCDILGEFPAGDARADRLRVRYDCPIPDNPSN